MKSPLKAKPLRNPGESVEQQLFDVLYDEVLVYLIAAIFCVSFAGLEWWRWYSNAPPSPKTLTVIAVAAVLFAAFKVFRAIKKIKRLKLGRDGEKAVGQELEKLRQHGAQVFHDIPGDGFNLDHVIIHGSGIYVIETKTWSKPDRGEAKLIFDGVSIAKPGAKGDDMPVVQVKSASKWLSELIHETTGRKYSVRPVVVYPGWFIQPTAEAKSSDVWVLNPKALPAFIANSRQQLSDEDVKLCTYHLSRAIRTR